MALTPCSRISLSSQTEIIQAFKQIQQLVQNNIQLKEENEELYDQLQSINSLMQDNLFPKIQELTIAQEKNIKTYKEHLAICGPTIISESKEIVQLQKQISELKSQIATKTTTQTQILKAKDAVISAQENKITLLQKKIEENANEKQEIEKRVGDHLEFDVKYHYEGNPAIKGHYQHLKKFIVYGTPMPK